MPEDTPNPNLDLWNTVCVTDDPDTTTPVEYGSRKFTAICPQSQMKRATELWGPYGKDWGVCDCVWDYLRNGQNDILEIVLHAQFFCPVTAFHLTTDIKFKPGDDCSKKILTDLTTKALSKLGFNADVFEGKYDDNKYVQDLRQKKAAKKPPPPAAWVKPLTDIRRALNDDARFVAILEVYGLKSIDEIKDKAQARSVYDHVLGEWEAKQPAKEEPTTTTAPEPTTTDATPTPDKEPQS